MNFRSFRPSARIALLLSFMMALSLFQCGAKTGSGTRETQPDFGARESIFSPGRGSVEFFGACFGLPSGEIAEFVGWMAAKVNLENLSKVCTGLSKAGFVDGVSTTKEPADID
jgi:hypothetical protein